LITPIIFDNTYNLTHPSGRTRKTIAQRFVWPGMQKDIANWAKMLTVSESKNS